ncbi:hypothetical protein BGZ58_004448 [Dissophora ornata]|nr:hypothetical protein BGZ58_004448 [Dissophora ornata]
MLKSSTAPLSIIRAALFLAAIWAAETSGSVISSNDVPVSNFELQTNLVSCTAGAAVGTGTGSASGASTAPVCSQPESKLFANIKIVNGTPQPGPAGVRGRLYDVGKLCDKNITDRVDRAWIAFLDCDGCPLATKLFNLQGSNPQAILIYNQTSCVFPPKLVPATTTPTTLIPATATPNASIPATSTPAASIPAASTPVTSILAATTPVTSIPVTASTAATTSAAAMPPGQVSVAPAPVAATTQAQAAMPTRTADQSPDGGNGGKSGSGNDDDDDFSSDSVRRPRLLQTKDGARLTKNGARLTKNGARLTKNGAHPTKNFHIKHPDFIRRKDQSGGPNVQLKALGADSTEATIESATVIAMADQGTVDYLFQILLGPTSLTPLPAALKTLIKIHPQPAAVKDNGNSSTTTDLMVSISPAYEVSSPSSSDSSISKAVFASVVSVLCVIICGLVLMYVVRPFILLHRRRRQQGNEDFVGEEGESEKQLHINNASSSSSSSSNNNNIKGDNGDSGEGGGSDYYSVGQGYNSYSDGLNYSDRLKKMGGELGADCTTTEDNCKDGCGTESTFIAINDNAHVGEPAKDNTSGYTDIDMTTRDDQGDHKNIDDIQEVVDERFLLRQLRQSEPRRNFPIKGSSSGPQPQISDETAFDHSEDGALCSRVPVQHASGQTENDGNFTATRSRNGSNLFYDIRKDHHSHPSETDAKALAIAGGLATSLYRHRMSMELSSASDSAEGSTRVITVALPSCSASASPVAPRTSLSDDYRARRSSMDAYHRSIQLRNCESPSFSREPKESTETAAPRASFMDDFATSARARHSMEGLRPGAKSTAPADSANAGGEQDGPVQSWSRYNTRQGSFPGK